MYWIVIYLNKWTVQIPNPAIWVCIGSISDINTGTISVRLSYYDMFSSWHFV